MEAFGEWLIHGGLHLCTRRSDFIALIVAADRRRVVHLYAEQINVRRNVVCQAVVLVVGVRLRSADAVVEGLHLSHVVIDVRAKLLILPLLNYQLRAIFGVAAAVRIACATCQIARTGGKAVTGDQLKRPASRRLYN